MTDHFIDDINSRLDQLECSRAAPSCNGDPTMVLILHRHGARFPTKAIEGDLQWPSSKSFWKNFGGQLTPTGSQQHVQLGKRLAKRYPRLLEGIAPDEINNHVHVQCSQVQRTLFSAWSLLSGFLPDTPRYFCYGTDRSSVNLAAAEANIEGTPTARTMGVSINVENASGKYDKMFHQLKTAAKPCQKFKKKENHKHPELQALAELPSTVELCDKLFAITQFPGLGPDKQMIARVAEFLRVAVQIEVAEAHGSPPLPNAAGIELTHEEMHLVEHVAKLVMKHHYRPVASESVEDGIGAEGGGFCTSEIARHVADKLSGKSDLCFVEFSAHDSTILAVASCLGLDLDWVGFTGHILVEVYPNSGQVKVVYNSDPYSMTEQEFISAQPRVLPLDGQYHAYTDLPLGCTDAGAFVDYCGNKGLLLSAQVLTKLEAFLADGGSLAELSTDGRARLTPEHIEELKSSFNFYDNDDNSSISLEELQQAFRRETAGDTTDVTLDDLRKLMTALGKDPAGAISFPDFLIIMGCMAGGNQDSENLNIESDDEL